MLLAAVLARCSGLCEELDVGEPPLLTCFKEPSEYADLGGPDKRTVNLL